jgi:hypothetical protein
MFTSGALRVEEAASVINIRTCLATLLPPLLPWLGLLD